MQKKATIGTLALVLSACSHVPQTPVSLATPPADKPIATGPSGVACLADALKAIRTAEVQGAARLAGKHLSQAYDLMQQAIIRAGHDSDANICQASALAEKEAKYALYLAVAAMESRGAKKTRPAPVRLDTAPVVKSKKPRMVKAAWHNDDSKDKESRDALLPSTAWALAGDDDSDEGMAAGKGAANSANAGKNAGTDPLAHGPTQQLAQNDRMAVPDSTFYRAYRGNGRHNASAGHDAYGDFLRYIVRKGDSLWAIAAKVFNNPRLWPEIFHSNKKIIENPDLIYPGQRFTFRPASSLKDQEKVKLIDEAVRWDIQRRKAP